MTGFGDLWVWSDETSSKRLEWYRAVAENRLPAKFRIAGTIPADVDLELDSEENLWAELKRGTNQFLERKEAIRTRRVELSPKAERPHLLDLCRELSRRMLRHCNFCAWDCRVDRAQGTKFGTCKLDHGTRVSTYFHHIGEDLIYRGTIGSGTIFFTSCNMRCAFCQNGDISTDKDNGTTVTPRTLATMAWLLRMEGCHNINWVGGDPIIHLHTIVEAISILADDMVQPSAQDLVRALPAKNDYLFKLPPETVKSLFQDEFNSPMLWNSNFFTSTEAMKILRLLIDVWLPDFKFGPGRCAITLARTPRYWETVTRNLALIEAWGEDATIRHLVMPNHVECCTYPVIDCLAENMPEIQINVMDQYHPDMFTNPVSPKYQPKFESLSRRPNDHEILAAYRYARTKGVAFESVTFESPTEKSRLENKLS